MTTNTNSVNTNPVDLCEEQLESIATKKATCPFIGSAVRSGKLKVLNSAEAPLAAIEEVATLGDSGGGDLGRIVLKFFAKGNHSKMPGPNGEPDESVPHECFSLDLAGSQGAHWGHSGILLGDPTKRDAGDFNMEAFKRLAKLENGGLLTTQAIGQFIADNLARDKGKAKVLPIADLTADLLDVFREIGDRFFGGIVDSAEALGARVLPTVFDDEVDQNDDELVQKLTLLAGRDNLVGSSGEFGLLFAFLAGQPTPDNEDDFVIRLKEVEQMMKEHRLPDGSDRWPKSARVWVHATTRIAVSAARVHFGKDIEVPDFLNTWLFD